MPKIIFGLGNPGVQYGHTRHNLGAIIVKRWQQQQSDQALPDKAIIIRPTLSMNVSGDTLLAKLRRREVKPTDLLVVHDDIELPAGAVKLEQGGSARGHNGVRSIQQTLGTHDFYRLRLGIGRPPDNIAVSDYVLDKLTSAELTAIERQQSQANQQIDNFIHSN